MTVAVEDGGEFSGTRTEAHALFCQDCAMSVYTGAVRAASNQGRAAR
jgi:hypothetical protein